MQRLAFKKVPTAWRMALLFLLLLTIAGCAGRSQAPDPSARLDETVLRKDVDSFDLVDAGGSRYAWRIGGPASRVWYHKNGDGMARIVRVDRQPTRSIVTMPASGAKVDTVVTDGLRTVTAKSHLGPRGELDLTGKNLARLFLDQTGIIPDELEYRHTVETSASFLDDGDPVARSNPRIPGTVTLAGRLGPGDIHPAVKDALVYGDDRRLKRDFIGKYHSPTASMIEVETSAPESSAKYRELLALLEQSRDDLGPERSDALYRHYRTGLERSLYAEIMAGGNQSLVWEYERLFGQDPELGRMEAVKAAFLRSLLEEKARADRLQAALEAMEQERRVRTVAPQPRRPQAPSRTSASAPASSPDTSGARSSANPVTGDNELLGGTAPTASPHGRMIVTANPTGASDVAVFSQPTSRSDVVKVLKVGGAYPLKETTDEYYLIEYEPNRYGYVHKRFAK